MVWVTVTIGAAFLQTIRNGLMKHVKKELPDRMVIFSRFTFAIPFALLWLLILHMAGHEMPEVNAHFFYNIAMASIFQVSGGYLFLELLGRRNFVTGITYAKTESLLTALFGALIFSEFISFGGLIAIVTGLSGVFIISSAEKHLTPKKLLRRMFTRSAVLGLVAGCLFGLVMNFVRQASLSLEGGDYMTRGSVNLLFMLIGPAILTFFPLLWKNKGWHNKIWENRKNLVWLGLSNSISTLCWNIALGMTKAAYVSMVGQVEILFAIFFTHKIFKEKIEKMEIVGIFMIVFSIIMLVWVH